MNIGEILKSARDNDHLSEEKINQFWQFFDEEEDAVWSFNNVIDTAYIVGLMKGRESNK